MHFMTSCLAWAARRISIVGVLRSCVLSEHVRAQKRISRPKAFKKADEKALTAKAFVADRGKHGDADSALVFPLYARARAPSTDLCRKSKTRKCFVTPSSSGFFTSSSQRYLPGRGPEELG
jgi:hypothetical protein